MTIENDEVVEDLGKMIGVGNSILKSNRTIKSIKLTKSTELTAWGKNDGKSLDWVIENDEGWVKYMLKRDIDSPEKKELQKKYKIFKSNQSTTETKSQENFSCKITETDKNINIENFLNQFVNLIIENQINYVTYLGLLYQYKDVLTISEMKNVIKTLNYSDITKESLLNYFTVVCINGKNEVFPYPLDTTNEVQRLHNVFLGYDNNYYKDKFKNSVKTCYKTIDDVQFTDDNKFRLIVKKFKDNNWLTINQMKEIIDQL